MFKRPYYIALAIVVVVTVVVLKLPGRTASQVKLAVGGLFLPLFGLVNSTEQLAGKASTASLPRDVLLDELDKLQKENQQLRIRNMQWEPVMQENLRFRKYYGWQQQVQWKVKLARVVGRDPANWWRTVRIDTGLRDGVTTNCAVFTSDGLVGRVAEAGFAHSQVVLVGDPDCRVSVMIEDTRDQGVIAPASSSPLDPMLVELSYLPRQSQLRAGQRVLTSGQGGVFPPGLVVGQLVDFRTVGYGLYHEGRVRLQVRMNALEEVWVKLP